MSIYKLCSKWMEFDEDTKNELINLSEEERNDRFYKEIQFGTGGIRGIVGAGINRINYYTIYRATAGLANFLNKNFEKPLVIIAYDSRHFSREFSYFTAYTLIKAGIDVKLFKDYAPTPTLSFAVRRLNASLGIVITASHNPKEYNGYKVYGSDGGQITKKTANEIFNEISSVDYSVDVSSAKREISKMEFGYVDEEIIEEYLKNIYSLSLNKSLIRKNGDRLKIVYTPLHGTGGEYVKKSLNKLGFKNLYLVKSQVEPNGDFPTVKFPNPEEISVFSEAIKLGEEKKADILIATDPDCDRVGVMVKGKKGEYISLTGNQIGTLLTYYILSQLRDKGEIDSRYTLVKTIVTTDIVEEICKDFNIRLEEVLTGFKYIGEKIKEYENQDDKKFLLGFEESYGYLFGDFVRDKDGVIGVSLICEMALYYKGLDLSLIDLLDKIYKKYGYYREKLISYTYEGINGEEKIDLIMKNILNREFLEKIGFKNFKILDYNKGMKDLPKENVISITNLKGKITVRPSGTEPKIKFYISTVGKTSNESIENIKVMESYVKKLN